MIHANLSVRASLSLVSHPCTLQHPQLMGLTRYPLSPKHPSTILRKHHRSSRYIIGDDCIQFTSLLPVRIHVINIKGSHFTISSHYGTLKQEIASPMAGVITVISRIAVIAIKELEYTISFEALLWVYGHLGAVYFCLIGMHFR